MQRGGQKQPEHPLTHELPAMVLAFAKAGPAGVKLWEDSEEEDLNNPQPETERQGITPQPRREPTRLWENYLPGCSSNPRGSRTFRLR